MDRAFASFIHRRLPNCDIVKCRHDTRLYFSDQQKNVSRKVGQCVGAFYLQNPGSADSLVLGKKQIGGLCEWPWGAVRPDLLMRAILDVLDKTLDGIRKTNSRCAKQLQQSSYVQLLNLSYICNAPNAKLALRQWRELLKHKAERDDVLSQPEAVRFIVLGWGQDRYRPSLDGSRVTNILKPLCQSGAIMCFPVAIGKKSDLNRTIEVKRCDTSADDMESKLKHPNMYPLGARNDRLPQLYIDCISPVLSQILLKGKGRSISRSGP